MTYAVAAALAFALGFFAGMWTWNRAVDRADLVGRARAHAARERWAAYWAERDTELNRSARG